MKPFWHDKTVLITSGPTREYLDPIRFLTNASSGRMGWELAKAARKLGARVIVVSGPVSLPPPSGVRVVPVVTAMEMRREALRLCRRADVVIAAAAVSDWSFPSQARHKIKRTGALLRVTLKPNPDIIQEISRRRPSGSSQVLAGFALETRRRLASAREKMIRKGLDLIVANGPASLGGGVSQAEIISKGNGKPRVLQSSSKAVVASAVLEEIGRLL